MASDARQPAVAGQFYEGERAALVREIEGCYLDRRGPQALPQVDEDGVRQIIGLVSPHAGYAYSGPCAARGMSALAADGRPDVFVIIGPCHGRVPVNAIQTRGAWATPLGESPIAEDVASAILKGCSGLSDGAEGFAGEHSLEVQLPFLQHLYGTDLQFVPVMMLDQSLQAAQAVGDAVGAALRACDAVIIASTDMTHFESAEVAERQDRLLIERMEALDPEGLLSEQRRRRITMCGYGAVAAMLYAARRLGASRARMLDYADSGAVGRRAEVVAYLSLAVGWQWRAGGR